MTINPAISAANESADERERKLYPQTNTSRRQIILHNKNTVSVDNIRGEESVDNKSEKQKQRRN